MNAEKEHKVTAIIPCYNEERYIDRTVRDLLQQDMPKEGLELLFMDGMSTDRTRDILEEYAEAYPFIRVLDNEERTVPYAMNRGIQEAKGEIIVRLDAHASYPSEYIRRLSEKLREGGVDNVGAVGKTEPLRETPKARAIATVLSHPLGVGNSFFRTGIDEEKEVDTVPFGCFWKKTLQQLGGYRNALKRNQDIELNKRLIENGGRILLLPDLYCTYYARESYKDLGLNNYKNGLWNIMTVYLTRDFRSLSIRHFIPLAFVLSILVPLILGILHPYFSLISLFVLLLYFTSILFVTIRTSDERISKLHMLLAFFVLHFSYGLGSLVGLFRVDQLFRSSDL